MSKKVLIVMNPFSGTKKANRYLTDIVDIFVRADYVPTVMTTTKRGDGTLYAKKYAKRHDLIVAIGGDGTFNEVVEGLLASGAGIPIGYIPAGSTNDFAASIGLPKDILKAAESIVSGFPVPLDIGDFNGRKFSYVASFGAFTKVSYSTSQSFKNALGHVAYVLEGINSLSSIRPVHMKIETETAVYEDDYIFGAISNATSVGGILTINPKYVDMSDGSFELLLVKSPKDIIELTETVYMLKNQNYESNSIVFTNSKEFTIYADKDMSWTLDGEYQEGSDQIDIRNLHHAIEIVVGR